ncbi:hypothetical protein ACE6H2_011184 [Prunus campanulata]
MSAQLNASSSRMKSRSLSPTSCPRLGIRASVEPSASHKGIFTFRVERNETKVSTSALASSVQTHYETFCLVGKVFGIPVNSRVIRHRLKSEWRNLQKMERSHICPVKISNKSFLQVEKLENEPNVFPRDLVLEVEKQQKLANDVILVFP